MVRNFLLGLILFLGLGLGTTVTLADAFSDYRQQQQQQLLGYQQQQQQEYERYLKALEEGLLPINSSTRRSRRDLRPQLKRYGAIPKIVTVRLGLAMMPITAAVTVSILRAAK